MSEHFSFSLQVQAVLTTVIEPMREAEGRKP